MYIYVLLFIGFMQGKAGSIWTYRPVGIYKKNYGISPVWLVEPSEDSVKGIAGMASV